MKKAAGVKERKGMEKAFEVAKDAVMDLLKLDLELNRVRIHAENIHATLQRAVQDFEAAMERSLDKREGKEPLKALNWAAGELFSVGKVVNTSSLDMEENRVRYECHLEVLETKKTEWDWNSFPEVLVAALKEHGIERPETKTEETTEAKLHKMGYSWGN